ncbi:MAG: hypothetical protein H7X70_01645 [Candidatus Kapabacteria bacterium]|nr:hypothetical protein [Candidatus Kapabacteria bacterium]
MAVLLLSIFAMLAIVQSLPSQETLSKQPSAEWKVRDTIVWKFIGTRFIHGEDTPSMDTSVYELAVQRVAGDTVFGVFRHVTSNADTSVPAPHDLTDKIGLKVLFPIWFDRTVADISFLSSSLRVLNVEPMRPSRSTIEFNSFRDVPHSNAQLLNNTRTEMRGLWRTLCPDIPDTVLQSHERELFDVTIQIDTIASYSTSASGAQPARRIISDTLTKRWLVQDVLRADQPPLKEVLLRSKSSESKIEFISIHRYDYDSLPRGIPVYYHGTSANFGQPGTLKIEIEAYRRRN